MAKFVKVSYECALYLEKCERAILRVAEGKPNYAANFDKTKHHIFHEELAHAIETAK